MDNQLPPTVLAICITGKIKPKICEKILTTMHEVSRIDGSYQYDNRGNMTLLYIDPIDISYVESEMKYIAAMQLFSKSLQRVLEREEDASWE